MIGITGSNGKTTVKEMVAAILRRATRIKESSVAQPSDPVLATEGNLNNDIGVPLMLLRLRQHHQYAVFEMGMNHIGEIAYLTQLVKPDVALITNAGNAHIEGLGSIEAVARAKAEIFRDYVIKAQLLLMLMTLMRFYGEITLVHTSKLILVYVNQHRSEQPTR